ncbi:alginate export family protein [Pseudomonas capeferrum]|uniref:alginate export family protein n=1 Tax=Pseudomonas capeferrum TaxID=1495066 RepID=UPI0015E41FE6|nr:alginate export family protein [Pseudomonas capeferrum]MBA1204313.1 alginate export family protein [Pseudomonas capeferrum]
MKVLIRSVAAGVGALYAGSGFALDSFQIGDVLFEPSVTVGAAYLHHKNQAFGGRTSGIGLEVDRTSSRFEGFVLPDVKFTGPQTAFGTVFGGVSAVGAMTRGDSDAGGFTHDDPESIGLETAFIGWKSADLFPSLGKDALTLSGGRQNFMIDNGFLIGDGHADQGKDAAAWIGPRTAFKNTLVAQLDTGKIHADVFDLTANADLEYADYKENLRLRGGNFEWRDSLGTLGATYYHTLDADNASRDGVDVYDVRAKGTPFTALPQVSLAGEYVWQKGGDADKSAHGWYAQASYAFTDVPWTPTLTYRRTQYSDDYDPMTYGYGGEYGTWYQGEIVGEYMLFNSNVNIDLLKLALQPRENIGFGVMGYRFRLDKAPEGVTSRDFANEVDVYANWTVTPSLTVSAVYGVALPGDAAKQIYGDNNRSNLFETIVTWSF